MRMNHDINYLLLIHIGPQYIESNKIDVDLEVISGYSEIQFRYDLIDCRIDICSPEVFLIIYYRSNTTSIFIDINCFSTFAISLDRFSSYSPTISIIR